MDLVGSDMACYGPGYMMDLPCSDDKGLLGPWMCDESARALDV